MRAGRSSAPPSANMEMVMVKSDLSIAGRYAGAGRGPGAGGEGVRRDLRRMAADARHAAEITGQSELLEKNPELASTIRSRLPYIDPLNHLQIELIARRRKGDESEADARGHPAGDQRRRGGAAEYGVRPTQRSSAAEAGYFNRRGRLVEGTGFEPVYAVKRADLQSAGINHSPTLPGSPSRVTRLLDAAACEPETGGIPLRRASYSDEGSTTQPAWKRPEIRAFPR